jgi:hypothetical protein
MADIDIDAALEEAVAARPQRGQNQKTKSGIPITFDGDEHPETGLEIFEGRLIDHDANAEDPSPATHVAMGEPLTEVKPVPLPTEDAADAEFKGAPTGNEEVVVGDKPKPARKKTARKRKSAAKK